MLLEVRDLHVEFKTRDGVAKAVNVSPSASALVRAAASR